MHIYSDVLSTFDPEIIGSWSALEREVASQPTSAINLESLLLPCHGKVQKACFEQIFSVVFGPFTQTDTYGSLRKLIGDPNAWVTASSFVYGDVIAQGAFGIVANCTKISTGAEFAMKIQPKAVLLKHFKNDKRRVMTEMQAYAAFDHPYVTKIAYAFCTESLAILVMHVSRCGDLLTLMRHSETERFSSDRVKFYTTEIVSALIYLHSFGFMHRDLKLGNILLNSDGHISLTDFGTVAGIVVCVLCCVLNICDL